MMEMKFYPDFKTSQTIQQPLQTPPPHMHSVLSVVHALCLNYGDRTYYTPALCTSITIFKRFLQNQRHLHLSH